MVVVQVELREEDAEQLREIAQRQNTTLERLISENIGRILPHEDEEFQDKLNRILLEDHELLRRLA